MPPEVLPGPVLAARTTLRLGGRALAEVVLRRPEDADGLGAVLSGLGGRPLVLGGGSNLLARDGELPLVVVSPRLTGEPEILHERYAGKIRVRVLAGVKLQRLVAWMATQGLCALVGLVGVPGTVGGAVAGNAGSYGDDMAGTLARVLLWTPEEGVAWRGREEFSTGYRFFAPRRAAGMFLVLAAEFDCEVCEPIELRQRMIAHLGQKKASQPLTAATAGCVFKNPPGQAAWRLLEAAGFRGKRLGNMAFSEKHANFLVNCGDGTGREAFDLIEAAREAVRTQSGHELELEVRVAP
ncbi:UDP-N-acetylenolpyruvoylglucosamine reductase [Solidesulfovibrio carbinoliphilus subsp. oakridgensis]|uniref:UDP-N-acetylenolpyruvoylglucosamine reductase n=1 Tax=Solidesulfovibrio carbinoliphilus subsp. oakridgensis TaxID=694327 RepID=G7Q4S2_9BACT|nr:FAD-binding protein [Solidesulfovibrio carbinoliphilus]EHJ47532.1 UDP-N-acetylenolpyruvoylglucosamine reductase [Solidesulfovibrio carbinoliphilus subsp. oakridgensis]